MFQILDNVQQALRRVLPQSIANNVICFVFYDHHPSDQKLLDITVCTRSGEVQEFYHRELVDTIYIEKLEGITEIITLRNSKCDLFYLVVARNQIVILSKKEKLNLHLRTFNVAKYKLEEASCQGLKIFLNDDAVPIIFDDDMNRLDTSFSLYRGKKGDNPPNIVNQLRRKLVEAKYSTKHNENILKDSIKLRQLSAFQTYKKTQFSSSSPEFKLDRNEISYALQILTKTPSVLFCNRKIVLLSNIVNNNEHELEDICVLIHEKKQLSIQYKSKIYTQITSPPFWSEATTTLAPENKCTLVSIVDFDEIGHNIGIDIDIVVSFTMEGHNKLLPLDSVSISAMDILGQKKDIFSGVAEDSNNLLLSIFATSERIPLCLRHITDNEDIILTPTDIFCKYFNMEKFLDRDNVVILKKSPYHIFYGMMVVFEDMTEQNHIMNVQVFARSSAQVLQLIRYIYDIVPYKIIITTPDYELTVKTNEVSKYNEEKQLSLDYTECVLSVRKQVGIIKEHIHNCLLKIKKDGLDKEFPKEIDLLALGIPKYIQFKNSLLEESLKGIKSLKFKKQILPNTDSYSERFMDTSGMSH